MWCWSELLPLLRSKQGDGANEVDFDENATCSTNISVSVFDASENSIVRDKW